MTKEEFNSWCEQHNITIEQSVQVLGISRSNAFKYANGSQDVPRYIAFQCEAIDLLPKQKSIILIQKRLA